VTPLQGGAPGSRGPKRPPKQALRGRRCGADASRYPTKPSPGEPSLTGLGEVQARQRRRPRRTSPRVQDSWGGNTALPRKGVLRRARSPGGVAGERFLACLRARHTRPTGAPREPCRSGAEPRHLARRIKRRTRWRRLGRGRRGALTNKRYGPPALFFCYYIDRSTEK
jgi:hypothetical protein